MIQLSERSSRIVDFSVKGQRCIDRCDADEAFVQDFSVQVRSPGLFRIEIAAPHTVITFDGKEQVTVQHEARTVQRVQVAGQQDEKALAPYQTLSAFLVEGWRPPLLATTGEVPARLEATAQGGPQVVLERPLQDTELARVEYWHRMHKGDFVRKRFMARDGTVVKEIAVEREHTDARTGYSFPLSWKVKGADGAVISWTKLGEVQINAGVPRTAFEPSVPDGFTPLP
ncbi:MAG: hypothetical protein ABIJ09_12975 [Pseudomonadota bacterium]